MKVWTVTTLVGVLCLSGSASAQDTSGQAEVLFEQGKAAMAAGDLEKACPTLAESMNLQVGIGIALWVGDCYERQGKTASAWAAFRDAAGLAQSKSDPREKLATDRANKLVPRLTRVIVTVTDAPAGLMIKRDGLPLGKATLGTPVPVDPGKHMFEASAPGYVTWQSTMEARGEGTTVRVEVPNLVRNSVIVEPPPPPGRNGNREQEGGSSVRRTIGLAVAGGGLAFLGVGSAFAISAKSSYDASNSDNHCAGNACDQTGLDRRDTAYDRATLSTVMFSVGAVALVAGAVLWFTGRDGS